jgi:hypothetical protein
MACPKYLDSSPPQSFWNATLISIICITIHLIVHGKTWKGFWRSLISATVSTTSQVNLSSASGSPSSTPLSWPRSIPPWISLSGLFSTHTPRLFRDRSWDDLGKN